MKTWIIAVIVIVIIAGAIAFILTHGPLTHQNISTRQTQALPLLRR
ncbi:MAG: hypothetical protein QXY37_03235 [Metallosphaera sp.]